jgi:hypothetical protein
VNSRAIARWVLRLVIAGWWALLALVILVAGLVAWHPYRVGPAQPIPFSHHVHATYKQISCLFCHDGADRSPEAGVPEVDKCLLCHNVIVPHFEPISRLHGYADRGQPVPWVRVYKLPEFVFFDHQMHIRRNVDCSECHGDVRSMDRIMKMKPFTMGFCVDCHLRPEYQASVDCWTCHR